MYLLLILGNPAWFWCNRSCVIMYILWEGMFVWYKIYILHTLVIHLFRRGGCRASCFLLQSRSVVKSFGRDVYINIEQLLPEATKQLSWLCCCWFVCFRSILMLTVDTLRLSSMVNTVCINTREDHQSSKSSSPTDQPVLIFIFLRQLYMIHRNSYGNSGLYILFNVFINSYS